MSKRVPSTIVKDILNCIEHIQQYIGNLSFDDFTMNYMVVEACLYNIQIIGEAVTQLPDNIKDYEQQIPWKLIKGVRNKLIHEYFGTDLPTIWNIIHDELPSFKKELERLFKKLVQEGQ